MRYAWTSVAILFIWVMLSTVVAYRPRANADVIVGIAAVGTGVLAWLVFRPRL